MDSKNSVPYGRIYFCHSRPFGVITTTGVHVLTSHFLYLDHLIQVHYNQMKKRKSTVFQNFVCEKKYRESKDIEIDRK